MADALANRSALKTIEDALLTAVDTALRTRTAISGGVAALRGVATMGASQTQSVVPDALAYISGSVYRWSKYSTAADNGSTVIKPSDAGAAGRWVKQANPGGTATPLCMRGEDIAGLGSGYLQSVILFEGSLDDDEMRNRMFNRRPAVAIDWSSRSKSIAGTNPGQLSQCDFSFGLWIVDENLRGDLTASRGDPVIASGSPGAYAIAGDLEDLLDGATGEQLGQPGIGFCRTGALSVVQKSLTDRRVVLMLELGVWATTSRRGSNAVPLSALTVQMQHALARPATADADYNFAIVDGMNVSLGTGLSRAPSNGHAVVSGTSVTVSGAPLHTFTAWRDTYRDVNTSGAFVYAEAAIGADAPAVASGTLRVGVTTTDSLGATRDVLLAPLLRNVSGTFTAAP